MSALTPAPAQPSRLDRRSRLVLLYAFILIIWALIKILVDYRIPSEGWILTDEGSNTQPKIIFTAPVVDGSPLQAGDQLIAVEGQSVEQIRTSSHAFFRLEIPDWQEGTFLSYTVLRQGAPVTVEVPLVRPTVGQVYRAYLDYGGVSAWVQLAGSLTFLIVGVLVFIRRPRLPAAQALFLIGVCFLFNALFSPQSITSEFYPLPPPSIPLDSWTAGINPSLAYLMLAFPTIKRPLRSRPRATLLALYLLPVLWLNLAYLVSIDNLARYTALSNAEYVTQVLFTVGLTIFNLVYSARMVKQPVERAQYKWMAVGALSFVVVGVGGWLISFIFTLNALWFQVIGQLGWFLFPICLGIAITRYRLFEIDIIIRRTLVYGSLSLLLGAFYAGSVLVLQRLFTLLTGQTSPAAVVISTLGIVVLFSPLRSRIQQVIDRRFFRRKYDTQQILAVFAQTARDENNLDALTSELRRVVQETMQPEHLGTWIGPANRPSKNL